MILRKKDKEEIIRITKQTFTTSLEIWAYGSRVKGTAHESSDLDLVIRSKYLKPIFIDEFLDFKRVLRESNIPILISVLDWARIPSFFHKSILECYEILVKIEKP